MGETGDAIEAGNGIGSSLAYWLVAESVDFALNALSGAAFYARGQGGYYLDGLENQLIICYTNKNL